MLCLVTGGASALMPLPAEGITLEEKQATTRLLLACGGQTEPKPLLEPSCRLRLRTESEHCHVIIRVVVYQRCGPLLGLVPRLGRLG